MIRIAQVVRPAAGGMRRHVSGLLGQIPRSVAEQTLFAPAKFQCDPPVARLSHRPLPIPGGLSILGDVRAIAMLARSLRGRFDLVHAHGIKGALIAVPAARIARVPILFTAHNVAPSGLLFRRILRQVVSASNRVIAVSNAVADSLPIPSDATDRIAVIPNGIDLAPFPAKPLGRADRHAAMERFISDWLRREGMEDEEVDFDWSDTSYVGSVGRLSREKGFDLLADAAMLLARSGAPAVRVLIAGEGSESKRLSRVEKRVPGFRLLGAIPHASYLFPALDIVAVPSRTEGQGIVPLEAMASWRPVVACRVGGLHETIVEGETGLLVEPESPAALARGIEQLLRKPDQLEQMGRAGRARVEEHYTLEIMISRTIEIYSQVLGSRMI